MKHKYYCSNLSNSIDSNQENVSSATFIQERELKEIFDTQYNDIFPKILSKTKTDFISLLKEKVSLHLKIINKNASNSSNSKYLDIFTKKYINDKTKVTKGLEELTKNANLQEKYLDILSCYIHCCKCSLILHKCRNRIIYYKNFIYCIHCQKVYNENQIKLYCPECKVTYNTKLRYVLNKRYEYFYPVAFKQYHCPTDEQQKIKCLECGNDLYYDIMCDENKIRRNTIKEIFCLKCKYLYNMNEVYFTCRICKNDFKSEAVFYNSFSLIKQQILLLVNILYKGKHALPDINYSRKCKCNISKCDKYFHENDNGTLYLGTNLEGQYIIVCNECFSVFKYNDFIWNCPICKVNFKSKKIYSKEDYQKVLIGFGGKKYNKKEAIYKSPSHIIIINNNNASKEMPQIRMKVNLSNISKDFYKNNDNDKIGRNKKVIYKINSKNSLNSIEQKMLIYKKFKKDNNNAKKDNNYNTLNENNVEVNYRLNNYLNNNSKTNKKISSHFSNFSFNNNKSETNSSNKEYVENKESNESTAHITSRNNKSISLNDFNVHFCNCPNCIIENEIKKKYYYNCNFKINKKLLYDDFFENDNNNNNIYIFTKNKEKENNYKLIKVNEMGNNSKRNNILKSKAIKEEENSLNKRSKRKQIKATNSKVDLTEGTNDVIKVGYLKKNIKSSHNLKRADSKENNRKVESRDNIKSVGSRNYLVRIESRERNHFEYNDCLKSFESNDQSKRYHSKNSIKENKKNENENENKLCKTDKKPKENIKCFIFRKGKLNNTKIEKKKLHLSLLTNKCKDNILDSTETNNYKNINHTEANENNLVSEISIERENKIKNMKNNIQNKISDKKELKKIQEYHSQKKVINNFRKNNPNKNNNVIKVNRYNSNKNKKDDSNLVFNKLKKYYEECACEECEKNILLNSTNLGEQIMQLSDKKNKYKNDFNSDNYIIIKLLGKGTYGKTYLVKDSQTNERFALKKIIINDKYELKDNEDEYNFILRLNKENPDLKVINIYGIEHKNLDKYTTVMYVLMEAANSDWEKELLNRCEKRLYYTESQLVHILSNLVSTFAYLQKKGISHRDIKPQNILCFDNHEYKISDFGEAKKIQNICVVNKRNSKYSYSYQDNTMKQTLRGTELYMSPVLFLALTSRPYRIVKHNTFKSDVFSLGMCFFLASSLDYDGLYEVREIIKNPSKTKLVVNRYLSMRYSQKYINLLNSMLQINEKDRPDFIELEKTIENLKY